MQKFLLISISALALAACSPPATNTSTTTTTTTTTTTNEVAPPAANAAEESAPAAANAATPTATPAAAGPSMPPPRAGLWELTTTTTPATTSRAPRGPLRSCSDGVTAPRMGGGMRGGGESSCPPQRSQGADGTLTLTSDCTSEAGVHIRSVTRITGNNQTDYRIHSERDVEGAPMPQMNGHHVTDTSARYIGACPANMPPGSIEIAGRVITREQMEALRGQRGGGGGGGM